MKLVFQLFLLSHFLMSSLLIPMSLVNITCKSSNECTYVSPENFIGHYQYITFNYSNDESFNGYEITVTMPDTLLNELLDIGFTNLTVNEGTCRVVYYKNDIISFELTRTYFFDGIGSGNISIIKWNRSFTYAFSNSPISIVAAFKKDLIIGYTIKIGKIKRLIFISAPVLIEVTKYSRKMENMLLSQLRVAKMKILTHIRKIVLFLHALNLMSTTNNQKILDILINKLLRTKILKTIRVLLSAEEIINVAKYNTSKDFLPRVYEEARKFGLGLFWQIENLSMELRDLYKKDVSLYREVYKYIKPLITAIGNIFEIIRVMISPREYIMVWKQLITPMYVERPWVIEVDGGGGTTPPGDPCDFIPFCSDIFSGDVLGVEVIVDQYYKSNYPDWLGALIIQFYRAVIPFNETYLPYDVNANIIPWRILSNWTPPNDLGQPGTMEYIEKLALNLATNINIVNHSYKFNGILAISGRSPNTLQGIFGARIVMSKIIPDARPKTLAIILDLEGISYGLGLLNYRIIAHEFSHAGEAEDLNEYEYICIMNGNHALRIGEWCLYSWYKIYEHHTRNVS